MNTKYDIKIVDEVIVIGYQFIYELRHKRTSFPIVREGIIATNIDEDLEDKYIDKNHRNTRKRILRISD